MLSSMQVSGRREKIGYVIDEFDIKFPLELYIYSKLQSW